MITLKVLFPFSFQDSTFLLCLCVSLAYGDLLARNAQRQGKQTALPQGGIDFSGCINDPATGQCCVEKEETVSTLSKDPLLECTHKNVEKCHYTYVTQFEPTQEEVCEENFEKSCQITFKQQAVNETVKKCYKPLEKVCNGQGPEECRTVYESSCSTRYVEKQPGKYVGDTKCEKLPIEICGAGCTTQEGPEECHDKVITSLIDVPEEVCDLNPQKTCRFVTKLVPKLKPEHECTVIPKETCNLKFTSPKQVTKPLKTKWCLDSSPPTPDTDSYDENNAIGDPIGQPRIGAASSYSPVFQDAPPSPALPFIPTTSTLPFNASPRNVPAPAPIQTNVFLTNPSYGDSYGSARV